MDIPEDPEPSLALLLQIAELSSPYIAINVVAFVVLIFLSAMISGSEVAFFSLDSNQLADFEKESSPSGQAILRLLERKRHLLATILIMNNMVNIAIVTLSTFFTWSLVGSKTTEGKVVVVLSAGYSFL